MSAVELVSRLGLRVSQVSASGANKGMARANAGFHRDSIPLRARCNDRGERAKPFWLLEKTAMEGAPVPRRPDSMHQGHLLHGLRRFVTMLRVDTGGTRM